MQGKVAWQSPSNLAIIKYWGKYGVQYPENPSISFTLKNAHSRTSIEYASVDNTELPIIEMYFEGQRNEQFEQRVQKFIHNTIEECPWLKGLKLTIHSENSFPHSSGIASSASGMSALALCICSIGKRFDDQLENEIFFFRKASDLARLGSGSASRSVYPYMAQWGISEDVKYSSNDFAIPYPNIAEVFKTFHDDILIVSKNEKSVSSTAGHKLMEGNIYAKQRYQQANNRLKDLLVALKDGDVNSFGKIAEDEALTLHALMMCSDPSYILMEPATLDIIRKVRNFRSKTSLPIFFSLDAGPNIHLLYPDNISAEIAVFIQQELIEHCVDGRVIKDCVGPGPIQIDI